MRCLACEFWGLPEGFDNKSRRQAERNCGRSYVAPEMCPSPSAKVQGSRWANRVLSWYLMSQI